MPVVQFSDKLEPCQIQLPSGPGKELKDIRAGAIHVAPGATRDLTQAEADWIAKHRKELPFKKVGLTVDEKKAAKRELEAKRAENRKEAAAKSAPTEPTSAPAKQPSDPKAAQGGGKKSGGKK